MVLGDLRSEETGSGPAYSSLAGTKIEAVSTEPVREKQEVRRLLSITVRARGEVAV